jgi:hypothetical protein
MDNSNSSLLDLAKFPPSTKIAIIKAIIEDYKGNQLEEVEEIAEEAIELLINSLEGEIGYLDLLAGINNK